MRGQVATFNELDAHLARKIGVLVVSRVEDAGREQNDVWFGTALWCERAQCAEQELCVLLDGTHVVTAEHLRERTLHDPTIREHVADARGHAKIVFEHDELAVFQANEIGACDRDVDIPRYVEADHVPAELLARVDDLARHDAVFEDATLVIDVFQEKVECGNALLETMLDAVPFPRRDDAREQVVRENALGALIAAVDGEGDALVQEGKVGGLLLSLEFFARQAAEVVHEWAIVAVQVAVSGEHLVVGVVELVVFQTGANGVFRGHRSRQYTFRGS